MDLPVSRSLRNIALIGSLCAGVMIVSGCSREATRSPAGEVQAVVPDVSISRTAQRQVLNSRPVAVGGDVAVEVYVGPLSSAPEAPEKGLAIIEAERLDRRERARNLAETRIDRARAEMEAASSSRLEARRREMQAENDAELAEARARIMAAYADQVRAVDLQMQGEIMNLHLKTLALKARQGRLGGEMDALTVEALDRLTAQKEQLDKRRAESVQSARERRDWEIAEVSRRLQDDMDRSLIVLQVDLQNRVEQQSKSLRDRVNAQMSGRGVSIDLESVVSKPNTDGSGSPPAVLSGVHDTLVSNAEQQFHRDYSRAIMLAKMRLEEARKREAEDAALLSRRTSGT